LWKIEKGRGIKEKEKNREQKKQRNEKEEARERAITDLVI